MKYFIVKRDQSYHKISCNGFIPKEYDEVYECPIDIEKIEDMDIVEELDEMGILVKHPVLNESKKAARLQAESEAQDQAKWDVMRAERNKRLTECDWTQLIDSPLSVEQKAVYASYRQTLRDLPENITDINNIQWPVKP